MTQNFVTCLNGRLVRADRAAIALADRGFRFGDGAFETIRFERGIPYQWELHIARLNAGLAALRITPPDIHWPHYAALVIKRNKVSEGFLRISVSRGVGSRGYLPHPPGMPATWGIEYLLPVDAPNAPYHLWLSTIAKIPPQCLPTQHKISQGLNSTLASMEACENQCDEALQLTTDGLISETASANIFWIANNACYTPDLATGCLAGTTRDAVLRLSPIAIHHVSAGLSTLEKAEAAFITNTRLGVWSVASIEPAGWGFNTRHPVLLELQKRLKHDRITATKQSSHLWQI